MASNIVNDKTFYKRLRQILKQPSVRYRVPTDRKTSSFQKRLINQFAKASSNLYMQSIAGSTERLARIRDYELIDINSELLSMALNIYADDSTTYNEEGKILDIICDNDRIKKALTELFYERLDIDFNLWHWVRNTCKYGDMFMLLDVLPDYGVTNFMPLPTAEVEREEGYDGDINSVRFKWMSAQSSIFENFQIAHFRMLGDDIFLPYGKSVIETSRKVWKQLNLIEDAMLIYRIQRAPERRVFKIDVGGVNPDDVPGLINKARDILKRQPMVDFQGQVDLRFNVHPIHKDSKIVLLNNKTITIEQLAQEYNQGKENWVYSIQDKTHKIVPGKVKWCGKNYTATKIAKITLDDDSVVKTALEHPFVLRDGSSIRADELKENMSLMPFYRKISTREDNRKMIGYEMVYNPYSEKYEMTHQLVDKNINNEEKKFGRKTIIHHKDFYKLNNRPDNLEQMEKKEHIKYHFEHMKQLWGQEWYRTKMSKVSSKAMKKRWENKEYRDMQHELLTNRVLSDEWKNNISVGLKNMSEEKKTNVSEAARNNRIKWNKSDKHKKLTIETNKRLKLAEHMGEMYNGTELHKSHNKQRSEAMRLFWSDPEKRKAAQENMKDSHKNHKVKSVEIIDETVDVYCMTVVGFNGEDDRHNFMIVTSEDNMSGICVKNSLEEDYFLPTRGKDSGTDITTLPGAQNMDQIDDVKYIQNKLFASVGIPKAYLTYESELNAKSTLSQQDIRFSRTIQRIQKLIISELKKIAMIHLYAIGYSDVEDLTSFKLELTNPSTVNEMQKLELYRTRFEVYTSGVQSVGVGRKWAQKKILGMAKHVRVENNLDIKRDSKFNAELQAIAQKVQQANQPPAQQGAEGQEGKQTEPIKPGEQPLDNIPGGAATLPAAATNPYSSQRKDSFSNDPSNPMSQSKARDEDDDGALRDLAEEGDEYTEEQKKEDEKNDLELRSIADMTKEDPELKNIFKKYKPNKDWLSDTIDENNRVSKEMVSLFKKVDNRFEKIKESRIKKSQEEKDENN